MQKTNNDENIQDTPEGQIRNSNNYGYEIAQKLDYDEVDFEEKSPLDPNTDSENYTSGKIKFSRLFSG